MSDVTLILIGAGCFFTYIVALACLMRRSVHPDDALVLGVVSAVYLTYIFVQACRG